MLLCALFVLCVSVFVSCSSDSEQEIKPVNPVTVDQSAGNENGRVAYSSAAVLEQIVGLGYVMDSTDVEHYSLVYGGTYEVTVHFRGDVVKDDKYKITYESTGHVGEETIFNGYIQNPSVLNTILGSISIDGLE